MATGWIIFACCIFLGAFLFIILRINPPDGYENEEGFHYGNKIPSSSPLDSPNKSEGGAVTNAPPDYSSMNSEGQL